MAVRSVKGGHIWTSPTSLAAMAPKLAGDEARAGVQDRATDIGHVIVSLCESWWSRTNVGWPLP